MAQTFTKTPASGGTGNGGNPSGANAPKTQKKKTARPQQHIIRRFVGEIDRVFVVIVVLLVCIGLVTLFSSSYSFAERYYSDSYYLSRPQLLFALGGLAAMALLAMFPAPVLKLLQAWALPIFIFTLLLNLAVPFVGVRIAGATRWIKIGPLPQFQPSELLKFSIVLLCSKYISVNQDRMNTLRYGLFGFAVIGGLAAVSTLIQNHLSATIIVLVITVSMMWAAAGAARHFGAAIGAAGVLGVGAFTVGKPILQKLVPHSFDRIMVWQNPFDYLKPETGSKGWQPVQSLYAISSGGFWGVGLGQSVQKHGYLPEPYNDYIFAILCEETGFFGALLIIILFGVFAWRGYRIAFRSRDRFASLLVFGITTHVVLQVILNLAVVTNTIPSTGISLPFFSHGGTSLILLLLEMGVVLGISRFSYEDKKEEPAQAELPRQTVTTTEESK